jgi:hypothetical protein
MLPAVLYAGYSWTEKLWHCFVGFTPDKKKHDAIYTPMIHELCSMKL